MRCPLKALGMMLLLSLIAGGCASLEKPWDRFRGAEMKLVRVETPEVIREDLPYEIRVTFQSRGTPQIQQACIRWMADDFASPSPSLTCYAYEVSTDQPIGSACTRWLADGPYSDISPVFCTRVDDVKYGNPGSFVIRMSTKNVKEFYNKLECYADYIVDGEVRTTNRVATKIRVER